MLFRSDERSVIGPKEIGHRGAKWPPDRRREFGIGGGVPLEYVEGVTETGKNPWPAVDERPIEIEENGHESSIQGACKP